MSAIFSLAAFYGTTKTASYRAGGWVTQQQAPHPPAAANAWGPGPGDHAQATQREAMQQTPAPAGPAPAWGAPRPAPPRQVC